MAEQLGQRGGWPTIVANYHRFRPLVVPIAFITLLAVIVVPLPPFMMDLLIVLNIGLAAVILLTTIFVESPLDFSVFPSLLLGTTLFRLVLNIASTRLILSANAATAEEAQGVAGKVIQAFSSFVGGDSLIVGIILFVILIIVQFVVITKGATRISEVAARFTLDGMPGKQMAIDADLNAGLIDEKQARERRETIAHEADFYGAMDGSAKFVRGDAIAGIIITFVNIFGGFAIGVFEKGWPMVETLETFTRLTIGDGLVSQIPAFIISIAAGLIVTRSSSRQDLGTELANQLTKRANVLGVTAGFLALLALTPLPTVPLLGTASVLGGMAFFNTRKKNQQAAQVASAAASKQRKASEEPAPIEQMLAVDTLELEVGYALVSMVDASQGGDLLDRITAIRRTLAGEMGLVMPPVRIRDNMQLQPNDYHLKIRGNAVAKGSVYPGKSMAMDSGLATGELEGMNTREPAFGLPAVWIDNGQRQRAESLNYTVVDASSVLATHLTEVVKNHAAELLTREETNNLITQAKEKAPKLVGEVLGGDSPLVKTSELQKVLQNLLAERVPIRDMETIIETLGDWIGRTRDVEVLTEYVRNALRRTICGQYVEMEMSPDDLDGQPSVAKLYCVSLDPAMEDQISSYIERSSDTTTMAMPPSVANRVTRSIVAELNHLIEAGHQPVVLASPQVRAQVRKLIEPHMGSAAVLGYNEISKGVAVESVGLVQMENADAKSEAVERARR
jgi:flagellar biosynthesis protein FlhA